MMSVEIYTRQMCGFCTRAKSLLQQKGVSFREFDATFDPELRKEMIQRTNGGSTFPQIFINETHVGGCDELMALERAGKLDALLAG
ncbi:MAG: glutaredoxin 3 [Stappia sp.]|uniref:glutaredoxin 3 n=1 Tax=Stappia sp. TaxID=1870903 RepID=UPI000C371972|nr:glutaredoxin 3 [Stappia sp.]MAA98486.1 glutaredoxin 3 [Stappia sp.]MBM21326.1 glutaredoxin 3 [Stappia sp.]